MNLFDETFIRNYCEDSFCEFVSDVCVRLKRNNMSYRLAQEKMEKLQCDFPKLRKIIEDNESEELTKEEAEALGKYLRSADDARWEEAKELFLVGMRESYYLFKLLRIIKK